MWPISIISYLTQIAFISISILQNHMDNHKNSMVGQTFVIELSVGDKLQAYMYTSTGLHDKPSNHLTQFTGILLKPVDQVSSIKTNPVQRSSSAMSTYLTVPEPTNRARSVLSAEP